VADLFVRRNAVEWGVGADVLSHGVFTLLQVDRLALFEPAPRLLVNDPETRLVGLVRRSFLGDRLELELRTVWSIERGAWFAFPRVSYSLRDDLRLRLGYLALGGPSRSIIGQFRDHD